MKYLCLVFNDEKMLDAMSKSGCGTLSWPNTWPTTSSAAYNMEGENEVTYFRING